MKLICSTVCTVLYVMKYYYDNTPVIIIYNDNVAQIELVILVSKNSSQVRTSELPSNRAYRETIGPLSYQITFCSGSEEREPLLCSILLHYPHQNCDIESFTRVTAGRFYWTGG